MTVEMGGGQGNVGVTWALWKGGAWKEVKRGRLVRTNFNSGRVKTFHDPKNKNKNYPGRGKKEGGITNFPPSSSIRGIKKNCQSLL